jgi:hypothetical protein
MSPSALQADLKGDIVVVFGRQSARYIVHNEGLCVPFIPVSEDGCGALPSFVSQCLSGDDEAFTNALVSALSVI